MASNTISHAADVILAERAQPDVAAQIKKILAPLASLRLTVALLAMGIFIVFVGTLAQVDQDMWAVLEQYFRTFVAWIPLQVFFPGSFFPSHPIVPGGFYFPGGKLIGLMMIVNLLTAHGIRFKPQAKGTRLLAGVAVIVLGMLMTFVVIQSGSNKDGVLEASWISWSSLWTLFQLLLAGLLVATVFTIFRIESKRRLERALLGMAGLAIAAFLGYFLWEGTDARLNDSAMRILWQLMKGGFAAAMLLAGCVLVFKKRSGVVLLHAGVLLLMAGEVVVGLYAVEGQMPIEEGQSVNYVQDIRTVELAVIDSSPGDHDEVISIPKSRLTAKQKIASDKLPFDVEAVNFFQNSALREVKPADKDKNPATAGLGLQFIAEPTRAGSGTDANGAVDMSAAYVKFFKKGTSELIGTHLVGVLQSAQDVSETVAVGDKKYDVFLRFKRTYKPYMMHLVDVRKDDYVGTTTPKNYSSDIRLVDPSRKIDRPLRIWMNNPLRFAGETFYQSSYHFDPLTKTEHTTLQVVSNKGWMIPYVACMIVAMGMLAHFSITLLRFLNRHANEGSPQKRPAALKAAPRERLSTAQIAVPIAVVLIFAGLVGMEAYRVGKKASSPATAEMDLFAVGELPLVYEGRVKPLDTLARNTLLVISGKETAKDMSGKTQPAIKWLLDVITDAPDAEKYPVFRIENLEVLNMLGLERRSGFRYALGEFRDKADVFNAQVKQVEEADQKQLSTYQKKIIELDRKIRAYTLVEASLRSIHFPPLPTEEEFNKNPQETGKQLMRIKELLEQAPAASEALARMHPPRLVPVSEGQGDESWEPYTTAYIQNYMQHVVRKEPAKATTESFMRIFDAYEANEVKAFNQEVAAYRQSLAAHPPKEYIARKTDFEACFNSFAPFSHAKWSYVLAFVITVLGWLFGGKTLNRTAFWLIAAILVLHTLALVARIYISGRPPVTNLYSSAVFIGWGAVVLGLVLEYFYRLGIGNALAAVAGFSTLLIADFLAASGDTFVVLQAVLDTQFWLATHVVCITLGYATTFVAGLLGVIYVAYLLVGFPLHLLASVVGLRTPPLPTKVTKELGRMMYGTLCFAIFFSFVGTVLGGLWADDSWGRFWGWDPKENGALIIVLWNALVLHARWGGMVGDRGLAMLAMGGNIVTSWSWFGVNELGIGLHSYGFTEGVLMAMAIFIASQLVLIAAGAALPREDRLAQSLPTASS
jgi:ABC-type transport system involved in cytochrome c biogenesis permease subunit